MMGKVLIFGAKGMLGQELCRAFNSEDVIAFDKADCDITDAEMVSERISALRPECIINAAAFNAVDAAENETTSANRLNGEAVGILAQHARSIGATVVHYSTDYVFDGTKRSGYDEADKPNPINEYGRSKTLGETWLDRSGGNFYLIRTSRLFGRKGNGEAVKESFVDLMIRKSKEVQSLDVVDEERASPTYVVDLAVATRALIEQQLPFGIYHRTNDGACTWYEFAKEIFRLTGWRGRLTPVTSSKFPRPAKRPAFSILRTTKLPTLRPWTEALEAYLQTLHI